MRMEEVKEKKKWRAKKHAPQIDFHGTAIFLLFRQFTD